jgi:hypothetical protein
MAGLATGSVVVFHIDFNRSVGRIYLFMPILSADPECLNQVTIVLLYTPLLLVKTNNSGGLLCSLGCDLYLFYKEYKYTIHVNVKIPFGSIFMSIFSKNYNLCHFVVGNGARKLCFFRGENIVFFGGGGYFDPNINPWVTRVEIFASFFWINRSVDQPETYQLCFTSIGHF